MAASFWDGPLRIYGNWPDWPPSTGIFSPEFRILKGHKTAC